MLTFRHAGDFGDILYSLPVVRYFGGGIMQIEAAHYTRVRLTPDKWCGIDLLLKEQPYVTDVHEFRVGQYSNYNLNDFRASLFRSLQLGQNREKHLCHWMLDAHGVPHKEMDTAWLSVKEPNKVARVVFSRSDGREQRHTYHNPRFPWHRVWNKYKDEAVFIGTQAEHEIFNAVHGEIKHYPTATLLEAARVISGCDLFIGNQSAPHAIAEGMKKRIVLEVWPQGANCLSFRPGVIHGWDQNVKLPEL